MDSAGLEFFVKQEISHVMDFIDFESDFESMDDLPPTPPQSPVDFDYDADAIKILINLDPEQNFANSCDYPSGDFMSWNNLGKNTCENDYFDAGDLKLLCEFLDSDDNMDNNVPFEVPAAISTDDTTTFSTIGTTTVDAAAAATAAADAAVTNTEVAADDAAVNTTVNTAFTANAPAVNPMFNTSFAANGADVNPMVNITFAVNDAADNTTVDTTFTATAPAVNPVVNTTFAVNAAAVNTTPKTTVAATNIPPAATVAAATHITANAIFDVAATYASANTTVAPTSATNLNQPILQATVSSSCMVRTMQPQPRAVLYDAGMASRVPDMPRTFFPDYEIIRGVPPQRRAIFPAPSIIRQVPPSPMMTFPVDSGMVIREISPINRVEIERTAFMGRPPLRRYRKSALLELEDIQKHFGMPIIKAAKEMKIGLTVLKRRCRELNISRWPHRKIKSLKTLIDNVKGMGLELREIEMLEEHRKLVERLPHLELTERAKKLRQACFKESYKKRRSSSTGSV